VLCCTQLLIEMQSHELFAQAGLEPTSASNVTRITGMRLSCPNLTGFSDQIASFQVLLFYFLLPVFIVNLDKNR
jgi:hypothetical protein